MLTVYTMEQSEQWDAIVRSFAEYDVYYLSGYVKAFQIHGDGVPLLFYYEKNGTRGINVVMKRDIAKDSRFANQLEEGVYFDFSSPYGYGGWLTEGEDQEALFLAYENWCRKNRVISEFVRFHPMLENHIDKDTAYQVIPLGNTVAIDLQSPEVIWANMISTNRNMIRKAKKNGIQIYSGRCVELYETFREIYNATMDKDSADSYYYFSKYFYQSVLEDLPQNAQVFYAILDGQVIAASIMLTCNGRMNYHLAGSKQEYMHLAPNNLLLYEAALWGCANGCKTLYLGGGVGSKEDNLFMFKKSFNRQDNLHRFYIGKKIFDLRAYELLVNMRDATENSTFFPAYRA